MEDGVVFVTVGTTSFNKLVETVTSPTICKILQGHGYKKLVLQIGKGEFEPECCNQNGLIVEFYRYKDSIAQDIAKASLVISHAGSGSILESLQAKRPLVVVINEELMGNHQLELAHELAEYHHLIYANCRFPNKHPYHFYPEDPPQLTVWYLYQSSIRAVEHYKVFFRPWMSALFCPFLLEDQ
ncbi:UDP-N-acetylglucosamine transferase subunit ALG13 homolog isoform X1 [Nematostella vectensis]|uniref:UDP-N-acetylglucosamine transferase subunit ALG13 homolog isoform X1 n=1 Tax=Nematostella vectensis TaxID=45351 RepID=UPI0020776CC8|nr:UDP-N-acetylglucosamine transferase subunit ALG13 homolog isoform X1 [Nematostella vectensis]